MNVLGRGNAASLRIDFKYGRVDCTANGGPIQDKPENVANFPNPRAGLDATLDWCQRVLHMNNEECVALLGERIHTTSLHR